MELTKLVEDSKTEQVHILLHADLNGSGRLFGGRLMEWMDIVAAVTARRHSNSEITTACVDSMSFNAPAYKNDTVVLIGVVTYTGKTSMEIKVDAYVEKLDGTKHNINTAYFVMVALDENEKPKAVPKIQVITETEKKEYESAKRRSLMRKERRENGF